LDEHNVAFMAALLNSDEKGDGEEDANEVDIWEDFDN